MEKIYMENNNSGKSGKSKYHLSIALSFVVAIFALVALVSVGFDQISYAAPATVDSENVTLTMSDNVIHASSGSGIFNVPFYYVNGSTPVFCIEHNIEPGDAYSRGDNIEDTGILYILNKSSVLGGSGIVTKSSEMSDTVYQQLETYATQVALWVYLYEKNPTSNEHSLTGAGSDAATNLNIIQNATTYSVVNSEGTEVQEIYSGNLYSQFIASVVDAAKNNVNVKSLSINGISDEISEVQGTEYYQTSAISVSANPSNDLESYTIGLSGIDGAFPVDENGAEIKDLKVTDPTAKFYVRIPKNKITKEAQTLSIKVDGVFNNYLAGTSYLSSGHQTIVTVKGTQNVVSTGESISIVGSPDTGMSTSQTIYVVGLIVLLCGVGIIYASTKPIKEF